MDGQLKIPWKQGGGNIVLSVSGGDVTISSDTGSLDVRSQVLTFRTIDGLVSATLVVRQKALSINFTVGYHFSEVVSNISISEGVPDTKGVLVYDQISGIFYEKVGDKFYASNIHYELGGLSPIRGIVYLCDDGSTWIGVANGLCELYKSITG